MYLLIHAINQNVVYVNGHLFSHDQICKDRIHEGLECRRRISETKVYDVWLKGSVVGDECCFPLICLFNSDIVVTPPDVKLGKDLGFS